MLVVAKYCPPTGAKIKKTHVTPDTGTHKVFMVWLDYLKTLRSQSSTPANLNIPSCSVAESAMQELRACLVWDRKKHFYLPDDPVLPAEGSGLSLGILTSNAGLDDVRTLDCWNMGEKMLWGPV